MHCPVYHITMGTAHCLLYQERARGSAKLADIQANGGPRGIKVVWAQKYQPCLTCEKGKEVRENGGNDMNRDVEELKKIHRSKIAELPDQIKGESGPGQICKVCGFPKPLSEFYESVAGSGKHVKDCKDCTKARVTAQAAAKRQAAIAQIAPNIAPESIENAINGEKVSDDSQMVYVKPQALIDRDFNGNEWVDEMERDYPVKLQEIPPGGKIENEEKPILSRPPEVQRTCERCGWTGPEIKFHLAGMNGHINVCRACIVKTRKENQAKKLQSTVELGPLAVVLDFADYPELLEALEADARRNFRTLANEILFRVVNRND